MKIILNVVRAKGSRQPWIAYAVPFFRNITRLLLLLQFLEVIVVDCHLFKENVYAPCCFQWKEDLSSPTTIIVIGLKLTRHVKATFQEWGFCCWRTDGNHKMKLTFNYTSNWWKRRIGLTECASTLLTAIRIGTTNQYTTHKLQNRICLWPARSPSEGRQPLTKLDGDKSERRHPFSNSTYNPIHHHTI